MSFIERPASKNSILRRTPICGVGVNDADYIVQPVINGKRIWCKFYRTWTGMLYRCLCEKTQARNPTYKNCTVADEWLIFSNFRKWMKHQDWKGKHLDKDLLAPGNKHYSPDNCIFVSPMLNTMLVDHGSKRGKYPQGVSYQKQFNKFESNYNKYGDSYFLGYFSTAEEASQAYKYFKSEHIIEIANKQTNKKLKTGLLAHAELIKQA